MAISTNSIIHYTKSLDSLKSILVEGFKLKYCVEKLYSDETSGTWAAHPMISFCDIPLSESYKHFNAYGFYGIGLTKSWAGAQRVNPVLYIQKGSIIGESLDKQFRAFVLNKKSFSGEEYDHLMNLKSIMKNYSGHLKRGNVDNPNYRFYDEREWRLVPDKNMHGGKISVSIKAEDYIKDKKKYNDPLNEFRIGFAPVDISYLIVKDDAEIVDLIKFIRDKYADKCTSQQLDILFSKVCSIEQITSDY